MPRDEFTATGWDRAASGWGEGPPPLWRRHSDAVNARLIERWLPGSARKVLKTDLFDELTSTGLYPVLSSRAEGVVGIDISPEVVRGAQARHPDLTGEVASVSELPFQTGSFDAVVSNSTLDHLAGEGEVAAALSELARVTAPGGRLLVTLDNPLNPLIALRDRMPRGVARQVRGVAYDSGWTCGPRKLRELLVSAGLTPLHETAVMHAPRFVVAALDRRGPWRRDSDATIGRLLAAERLERLPTRYLTGHFIAALAVRSG